MAFSLAYRSFHFKFEVHDFQNCVYVNFVRSLPKISIKYMSEWFHATFVFEKKSTMAAPWGHFYRFFKVVESAWNFIQIVLLLYIRTYIMLFSRIDYKSNMVAMADISHFISRSPKNFRWPIAIYFCQS